MRASSGFMGLAPDRVADGSSTVRGAGHSRDQHTLSQRAGVLIGNKHQRPTRCARERSLARITRHIVHGQRNGFFSSACEKLLINASCSGSRATPPVRVAQFMTAEESS